MTSSYEGRSTFSLSSSLSSGAEGSTGTEDRASSSDGYKLFTDRSLTFKSFPLPPPVKIISKCDVIKLKDIRARVPC